MRERRERDRQTEKERERSDCSAAVLHLRTQSNSKNTTASNSLMPVAMLGTYLLLNFEVSLLKNDILPPGPIADVSCECCGIPGPL